MQKSQYTYSQQFQMHNDILRPLDKIMRQKGWKILSNSIKERIYFSPRKGRLEIYIPTEGYGTGSVQVLLNNQELKTFRRAAKKSLSRSMKHKRFADRVVNGVMELL